MRLRKKFSKPVREKHPDIPSLQHFLSFHQEWKRRTIGHFLIVTGRLSEASTEPQMFLGNEWGNNLPLTICIHLLSLGLKSSLRKKRLEPSSYWNSDINRHVWWVGGPHASQITKRSNGASEGTFQPQHKVSILQSKLFYISTQKCQSWWQVQVRNLRLFIYIEGVKTPGLRGRRERGFPWREVCYATFASGKLGRVGDIYLRRAIEEHVSWCLTLT